MFKGHIYTSHISCICRLILNEHLNASVTHNHRIYQCHTQSLSIEHYHITSYSTFFPSHLGVLAQNFSNFEPIYVIPCTVLFQIALLF